MRFVVGVVALAAMTWGCREQRRAPTYDAAPPPPSVKPLREFPRSSEPVVLPPGLDPERVALATSICAAAYRGNQVGCRSHPPFVRREQRPDGKIVEHEGDPHSFCPITGIVRGAFSRERAKQAIVAFGPCLEDERSEWSPTQPGSAVLVEDYGRLWQPIGYEPDVDVKIGESCTTTKRGDDHDVLYCRMTVSAPPKGEVTVVFLLDFARGAFGKRSAGQITRLYADSLTCANVEAGHPAGIAWVEVTGMSLSDRNADGTPDPVITVKRSRVPPSASLEASLRASCRSGAAVPHVAMPPAKEATLEFVSDGDAFAPTAATKKLIDQWTADAPKGMNGLAEIGPMVLPK
jgi:hypothetical protein